MTESESLASFVESRLYQMPSIPGSVYSKFALARWLVSTHLVCSNLRARPPFIVNKTRQYTYSLSSFSFVSSALNRPSCELDWSRTEVLHVQTHRRIYVGYILFISIYLGIQNTALHLVDMCTLHMRWCAELVDRENIIICLSLFVHMLWMLNGIKKKMSFFPIFCIWYVFAGYVHCATQRLTDALVVFEFCASKASARNSNRTLRYAYSIITSMVFLCIHSI